MGRLACHHASPSSRGLVLALPDILDQLFRREKVRMLIVVAVIDPYARNPTVFSTNSAVALYGSPGESYSIEQYPL